MADELDADVFIVRQVGMDKLGRVQEHDRTVLEAVIRHRFKEHQQCYTDMRIAILGGHGEGKSTLLGYITHGIQDNGRGRSRLSCARHRHEIESGRTSSISHEIIGYDSDGRLINYANEHINTWEQICEASTKVITFLDLCGHAKYLRTTISGMSGYCPDYAALVISGNLGNISEMTHEHLAIAVMLRVPVFVIVTKVDIATRAQLQNTLNTLVQLLRSPGVDKLPFIVRSENDFGSCTSTWTRRGPEVPIFLVSNVTGTNIDLLQQFFSTLPKPTKQYHKLLEEPVEFQIEKVYTIPDVGLVVGGMLQKGRINIHDKMQSYNLGPDNKGNFIKVQVSSIHKHRMPSHYVHCGQVATLAITSPELDQMRIQRGMVLLGTDTPTSYYEFEVELLVLYHPTGVVAGTCGMLYSGSIRQQARVITVYPNTIKSRSGDDGGNSSSSSSSDGIDTNSTCSSKIRSGKEGRCILRFMNEPKYLCIDAQILFVDGKAKCLGRVTKLVLDNP